MKISELVSDRLSLFGDWNTHYKKSDLSYNKLSLFGVGVSALKSEFVFIGYNVIEVGMIALKSEIVLLAVNN